MSRHWKGAIIERVEHPKTKRCGVVRLDKGSMTFFAREDDTDARIDPFHSDDGSAVRSWLLKQLGRTTGENNLTWVAVIEIDVGEGGSYYDRDDDDEDTKRQASMKVEITRYWIALTKDQREWRKLKWNEANPDSPTCIPDDERYASSENYRDGPKADPNKIRYGHGVFRLPSFANKRGGGETVLPYTIELWAALAEIVENVKASRKTLNDLLMTKEGLGTLHQIGVAVVPKLLANKKSSKRRGR